MCPPSMMAFFFCGNGGARAWTVRCERKRGGSDLGNGCYSTFMHHVSYRGILAVYRRNMVEADVRGESAHAEEIAAE